MVIYRWMTRVTWFMIMSILPLVVFNKFQHDKAVAVSEILSQLLVIQVAVMEPFRDSSYTHEELDKSKEEERK